MRHTFEAAWRAAIVPRTPTAPARIVHARSFRACFFGSVVRAYQRFLRSWDSSSSCSPTTSVLFATLFAIARSTSIGRFGVPVPTCAAFIRAEHDPLQRNVPVLAPRPRLVLRQRGLEGVDQNRTRAPRLDHVVHVASLRRGEGVGKALLVVLDQLGAARRRIVG